MTEIEKAKQTQMTPVEWSASGDLSPQQWLDAGKTIARVGRAWRWWLGDWINYADAKWGDRYDEAQHLTGFSYSTLTTCASLAKKFPAERRHADLSWSHHEEVAALDNEAQDTWLNRCDAEDLSRKQLRKELDKGAPKVAAGGKIEPVTTRKLAAVPDPPDAEVVPQHTVHFDARIESEGDELTELAEKANAALRDLGFDVVDWKVAA